jgi:hypothetical protein
MIENNDQNKHLFSLAAYTIGKVSKLTRHECPADSDIRYNHRWAVLPEGAPDRYHYHQLSHCTQHEL